jgi:hypothetical protein
MLTQFPRGDPLPWSMGHTVVLDAALGDLAGRSCGFCLPPNMQYDAFLKFSQLHKWYSEAPQSY